MCWPVPGCLGPLPLHELKGIGFLVFPGWILQEGVKIRIFRYSNDCIGKQSLTCFVFHLELHQLDVWSLQEVFNDQNGENNYFFICVTSYVYIFETIGCKQ